MFLQNISLVNFKNYENAELEFNPGVNCFAGNNGEGKTNLLDAIHYLSLCKSYFNPIDSQNIRNSETFFVIQGKFEKKEKVIQVYCGVKRNQKKIFKVNNNEYERLAEHIGLLPIVMVTPVDSVLITEGSEERRRLIDSIISQYDGEYLYDLISYNRVLQQRNTLLKQAAIEKRLDTSMLEIYDEQIVPLAETIYKKRKQFLEEFIPIFQHYYEFITSGNEIVNINYESQLEGGGLAGKLKYALVKDRAVQYTTVGVHKDDLVFQLGNFPVKKFGSQGQQKSFLIAVKLAQFDFIKKIKKIKPVLLLDDIFDKLDEQRMRKLMELVSKENFGQIFITDTHKERVQQIFESINVKVQTFLIDKGVVTKY